MHKLALLIGLVVFLACRVALAGETISTTELESYFYKNGEMKRSNGQFETTYYMEGNTVTRTRVYDFKYKKVIPDDTVYQIQRQLWSDHPLGGRNSMFKSFAPLGNQGLMLWKFL